MQFLTIYYDGNGKTCACIKAAYSQQWYLVEPGFLGCITDNFHLDAPSVQSKLVVKCKRMSLKICLLCYSCLLNIIANIIADS